MKSDSLFALLGAVCLWMEVVVSSFDRSLALRVRRRVSGVPRRIKRPENSSTVEEIIAVFKVVFVMISAPMGVAISSETRHMVLV